MNENNISIERAEGQLEGLGFATELLKQLKDTIKRQWILLIIVLGLWAGTISGFVWYLYQYDFVSYDYSQDGDGFNNMNTGEQGDVDYNGPDAESEKANP